MRRSPNFSVFDNYIQDASYLTGMIAGSVTKKGSIGMVGGYPIPEVNRLMNAFMKGVAETNTSVKFQVAFIGSWFDPPKAKETALAQIDAGADVMYAERFGVSDAAKEKGILAIGNVINTQADYPADRRRLGALAFRADARSRHRQGEGQELRRRGLRPLLLHEERRLQPGAARHASKARCRPTSMAKVAEREKAIKDGSFTVEINDNEPKSS